MLHYKLRTLLLLLAILPPVLAWIGWHLFGLFLNLTDGIFWIDD